MATSLDELQFYKSGPSGLKHQLHTLFLLQYAMEAGVFFRLPDHTTDLCRLPSNRTFFDGFLPW